ncbi:scarecrow-like protein 30 [Cornus florida]|uniref:scarecrow-like protein 30 n=1 Tax=Cornus florida TaxID=4283 RepID=UPI0028A11618|nr:scarecrow-like protein 30 [Cornus florida]
MDTLVQGYSSSTEGYDFHHHSIPALSAQHHANGHQFNRITTNPPHPPGEVVVSPCSGSSLSSEGDSTEEGDFSDATLRYISQMLMEEEDLEHKPCMYHDCLALQAAEKSFYDVLGEEYPPELRRNPQIVESPDDDFARSCSGQSTNSSTAVSKLVKSEWVHDQSEFEASFGLLQSNLQSSNNAVYGKMDSLVSSFPASDSYNGAFTKPQLRRGRGEVSQFISDKISMNYGIEPREKKSGLVAEAEDSGRNHSPNGVRGKMNHFREDSDYVEKGRSNKQLASNYPEEPEQLDMYDKVLLCPNLNPELCSNEALPNVASIKLQQNGKPKASNVGRPRGKRQGNRKDVVDLRTLLTQCAQAVANSDVRSANDLLMKIRQHSSAYGDGGQRLAHYVADALEARLAGTGTGTALHTAFTTMRISAADILKAYKVFVTACPFIKMSYFSANRIIRELADNAMRIHIIDFGILYGFQWPCLIQRLSKRSSGPLKLRITGIDFPQPGFRPAARVEETGRRLANYCERFNIPFEYNAIAKKWDTIRLEDLKFDRDEVLVVNCMNRLVNVPDETVVMSSPRDAVLNLIKRISPDIFIHGVINGTYSAPFFFTRFREALYHFSSLFDMFEASAPAEDQDRMLFEKEIFGRDAMNVIACEGTERVERPETYKQWQVRIRRAGFRQLPLNQEMVKDVRTKVKSDYHSDFVVDEDNNWMLQGWKGRIIYALSCWKPVHEN